MIARCSVSTSSSLLLRFASFFGERSTIAGMSASVIWRIPNRNNAKAPVVAGSFTEALCQTRQQANKWISVHPTKHIGVQNHNGGRNALLRVRSIAPISSKKGSASATSPKPGRAAAHPYRTLLIRRFSFPSSIVASGA
jgi:hypothetical protein